MFRYLFIAFFLFFSGYGFATAPDCEALELIAGQEKYNESVCHGMRYFQLGLYKQAADHYLSASAIKFPEPPNYRLNARIAHDYLLMGNLQEANHYIARSALTLSLLSGIYSCEEDENGLPFVSKDGRKPLASSVNKVVAASMCGGAYTYIYNKRFKQLSAVVLEGELIQYHLMVAKLINERNALE